MPALVLLAIPLAAGAVAALVVRRWPALDPAQPAQAASALRREVRAAVDTTPAPVRWRLRRASPATAAGFGAMLAWLVTLAGGVTLAGLLLAVRAHLGLDSLDPAVAAWAARMQWPAATTVMRVTTDLGATAVVVPAGLLLALLAQQWQPGWGVPLFLLTVVAGQLLLSNVLKVLVHRARPAIDPLGAFAGPSFPSGHSTAAAACWAGFALVVALRLPREHWPLAAGTGVAIGAYVATTRVLLGVHWLSDAVAGLALGWSWFAACCLLFGGRLLRPGYPLR